MITLDHFCDLAEIHKQRLKLGQVALLLFFNAKTTSNHSLSAAEINKLLHRAGLPKLNSSRFRRDVRNSRQINKGDAKGTVRLARVTFLELESKFGELFKSNQPSVSERAEIGNTPFLTRTEIEAAREMAELYLIIHCLENSARKMIDAVLTNKLGPHWFEKAVTKREILDRVKGRREKEQRNKWITPRGSSELFYLDWSDLLHLLKKYEVDFKKLLPDFDFVETRFHEVERFRNIVAHNGALPSDDDFQAVVLYFKQWCKQVK